MTEQAKERQRLMLLETEERLASPHLERLAKSLIAHWSRSGMGKAEFAESIGLSGSQFRYLRMRLGNPSIRILATIAEKLNAPLYELIEGEELGPRRGLSGQHMVEHLTFMLRRKFAESGLSSEEFAKMANLSLPQLDVMLRGAANPSLLVLLGLANRLGLGLWELLGVEAFGDLAQV